MDIEFRPKPRQAVETEELSGYITLIEGGSRRPMS